MTRFRRVIFPTALLLAAGAFVLATLQSASGQSGRGPQPDPKERKTDKRKYPGPPPKIRLPENPPQQSGNDSGDIIRINSDLVNVVVTVGGRPLNASLDLKPEDFEILETSLSGSFKSPKTSAEVGQDCTQAGLISPSRNGRPSAAA